MKTLLLLVFAFLSAPALAAVSYQPQGKEISLADAAAQVLSGTNPSFTFDHGTTYVEFTNGANEPISFARANTLAEFEGELRRAEAPRQLNSANFPWEISWNKLSVYGNTAFDSFTALRVFAEDSKGMDPAENESDLFRSVVSVWDATNKPMSITGPIASVLSTSSNYEGGAHPSALTAFVTYDYFKRGPASLLDTVDNTALLRALQADPYLLKVAKDTKRTKEFLGATQITDFANIAKDMMESAGLEVTWAWRPLEQFEKFAFWDYDVKTQTVSVRIGLEYSSEVVRGFFKQLGLRVKVKPEAAEWLSASKKSGLFMKDVKNIIKN